MAIFDGVYSLCDGPGFQEGHTGDYHICSVLSLIYVSFKSTICVYVSKQVAEKEESFWSTKLIEAEFLADVQIDFVVNRISNNRNGFAVVLAGSDGLCVMYLYGRTSNNDKAIVCRDFDLSSDLPQPEQEYYLQPVEPGRSRNPASIYPVDFSFGGDHLWDRFSGPLRKVHHGREDEDSAVRGVECEGCAVNFLYNKVSTDSILVTAWSGGQLQIDALADEIQPVWTVGSPPHICVDSHGHILVLAMICESTSSKIPVVKLDQPLDHTVWLGHPQPLLRLATVDLALPMKTES
ncbi:hypothetical protein GH714_037147 [Hevea brasiliensis]|uniref:Uncharacterized protein n=1 Tax=Hevea brasiliensis TaxID=3981 RepID=A0A6A6L4D2_HEVBR|nr:hypothetical protein GH714_037147 [Hevea brasiliensis]